MKWLLCLLEAAGIMVPNRPLTKTSKEKGETAWKLAIERLADLITELSQMQL
jgi:hypothetical protein